eukprot:CAMPEP_0197050128 /NCGR_PEP_ID=MMETSP1384-20130603/25101_1 /TAXON_ID=29189 /ORGANISM="Ammonia sp." /LENGTH=251 /DNA_ID=CAMNT_0042482495 /DNA_START=63 /DNA_END=818 /DNA_ORIENTATION=+
MSYQQALANLDQIRQKEEKIYHSNTLNLQQRVREMQDENDMLRTELVLASQLFTGNEVSQQISRSPGPLSATRSSPPKCKDKNGAAPSPPYGIYRLQLLKSPQIAPGGNEQKKQKGNRQVWALPDEILHRMEPGAMRNEPMVEIGITDSDSQSSAGSAFHVVDIDKSPQAGSPSVGSLEDLILAQSATNEIVDTQFMMAQIEEIEKLNQINHDNEALIHHLRREIHQLKIQNKRLVERTSSGFKCIGLWCI